MYTGMIKWVIRYAYCFRVVATRPGSQRFQTVPRGLSLESFGERVFSHEGVVWGKEDLSQRQEGVRQHDGTLARDVHISNYEEAIRYTCLLSMLSSLVCSCLPLISPAHSNLSQAQYTYVYVLCSCGLS